MRWQKLLAPAALKRSPFFSKEYAHEDASVLHLLQITTVLILNKRSPKENMCFQKFSMPLAYKSGLKKERK